MRNYPGILALLILSIAFSQCQKEVNDPGNTGTNQGIPSPLPVTAILQGTVYNELNQPAAGVKIKVGSRTALTNYQVFFRIPDAPLDKTSTFVSAEKNGYFKTCRVFSATSGTNHIEIKLTKRILAGTIDGLAGGEVNLNNGGKVELMPNSIVVSATGNAYSGTVNVYAAFIDPLDPEIDRTIPGSFLANNTSNNRVIINPFGIMAVELTSTSGEKLQIKSGTLSKLTLPVPLSLAGTAPSTLPMWHLDEGTGIWKEEGSATRNGNVYTASVNHYTFWNCGTSYATVPLSFILKNASGYPVVHASVKIFRAAAPDKIMAYGYTDSLGQGNPMVAANHALIFKVYDPCGNVVYSQNMGPFSQSSNAGVITLPASAHSVTVTGQLKNCNGHPVTSGYGILNYNNVNRLGGVNANGEFAISFLSCASGPSPASFAAVDLSNNQQGSTQNITIGSAVTNIGVYTACGISTTQYMNYTLDGISYSIPINAMDSLLSWSKILSGTTTWENYFNGVSGLTGGGVFCSFKFHSASISPGNYSMNYLVVNNLMASTISVSVNIPIFAQSATEFNQGSFSGSFIDLNGNPHTLSGNFRIRRAF